MKKIIMMSFAALLGCGSGGIALDGETGFESARSCLDFNGQPLCVSQVTENYWVMTILACELEDATVGWPLAVGWDESTCAPGKRPTAPGVVCKTSPSGRVACWASFDGSLYAVVEPPCVDLTGAPPECAGGSDGFSCTHDGVCYAPLDGGVMRVVAACQLPDAPAHEPTC